MTTTLWTGHDDEMALYDNEPPVALRPSRDVMLKVAQNGHCMPLDNRAPDKTDGTTIRVTLVPASVPTAKVVLLANRSCIYHDSRAGVRCAIAYHHLASTPIGKVIKTVSACFFCGAVDGYDHRCT